MVGRAAERPWGIHLRISYRVRARRLPEGLRFLREWLEAATNSG